MEDTGHVTSQTPQTLGSRVWSHAPPRPTMTSSMSVSETTALQASQNAWDRTSLMAMTFLHNHVEGNIYGFISSYKTASEMWNALMGRYHNRDGLTLTRCFRDVIAIRYCDSNDHSIADHLKAYERLWNDGVMRTADAKEPTGAEVGNSMTTVMRKEYALVSGGES